MTGEAVEVELALDVSNSSVMVDVDSVDASNSAMMCSPTSVLFSTVTGDGDHRPWSGAMAMMRMALTQRRTAAEQRTHTLTEPDGSDYHPGCDCPPFLLSFVDPTPAATVPATHTNNGRTPSRAWTPAWTWTPI